MKFISLILVFILASATPVLAQNDVPLNPEQEQRFEQLGQEIRCVVCQSEPVATSQAKIAIDMREVIKERILKGENDNQIRQYFADHYGEYVLLRPQMNSATYLLWGAPFLLLLIGAAYAFYFIKRNQSEEVLEDEETEEALKALEELK